MGVREALDALAEAAGQDPVEVRVVRAYVGKGVVQFLTGEGAVLVDIEEPESEPVEEPEVKPAPVKSKKKG